LRLGEGDLYRLVLLDGIKQSRIDDSVFHANALAPHSYFIQTISIEIGDLE
jgi:hypothetical protein